MFPLDHAGESIYYLSAMKMQKTNQLDDEIAKRRDDALRRALSMPPKPNKPDSAGGKKKAAPKGRRPKSSS
jgi:hypothetical protein